MTSLQAQDAIFKQAEDAILNEIDRPMPTKELVDRLRPQFRDEYPVRAAIWFLIGRGEIEIIRDRNQVLLAKV